MSNFPLSRFINFSNAGEGSNIPPRQFGDIRVPIVSNLKILRIEHFFGGTTFTLGWTDPEFRNVRVSQYNIFVTGIDGTNQPQGPYAAQRSPAVVRLTTSSANNLVFTVQTQLTNGLTSALDISPSVSGDSTASILSAAFIGASGVTAGTYGTSSSVGQFTVDSSGLLTAASNTTIYLDRLRLPVSTKTSGPYTLVAGTDYLVIGNTTSGSFSLKLPASPTTGDSYAVKKSVAANTLTLDGNGKNIDGAATISITTQYTTYTVIYNGTEWSIL